MKKDLTEIICVIDKSGSMAPRTQDVIGGYNRFLEDQKKEKGGALLTLALFDTDYKIIDYGIDISMAKGLTEHVYQAGGMTALLDAVGRTIDKVGDRLAATNEKKRPGKVIFLIITDGEENSSREYTLDRVKGKIKSQQETFKWEFVFLGANQDAFASAMSMGIPGAQAVNFRPTAQGVQAAYANMSHTVSGYRDSGKVDMSKFKADEEEAP